MAFPVLGLHRKSQDIIPLLMERPETRNDNEHVIDITSNSDASSSSNSSHERRSNGLDQQRGQDPPSTSSRGPHYQSPVFSAGGSSNTRSSSLIRRANSRNRQRSPLNSVLWISVELLLTVSQIVSAVIVLSLSKHEKPRAPLRAWIVGYASGCVAILPLLYWRFKYRNLGTEQDPSQHRQDSSFGNNSAGHLTRRSMEEEDGRTSSATTRGSQSNRPHPRLKAFAEYFKMALDCFFAVWFVVGNVWIFGGHSPANEAPQLYRLCIVFLTFSCIGYAMPFILCATICCCLPCIISVLGFREDLSQNRGATQDSINSLPTYKFKMKKNKTKSDKESSSSSGEGGIVAAGTEKERAISGEDAVCCICLAKYVNNDELKELPCSHFFHKDCVDKWLKINATCPLCKAEVGETLLSSLTETTANLRNGTML